MSWEAVAAVGSLLVSLILLLSRFFGNALTRAEHEEFKEGLSNRISAIERWLDRLEDKCRGMTK